MSSGEHNEEDRKEDNSTTSDDKLDVKTQNKKETTGLNMEQDEYLSKKPCIKDEVQESTTSEDVTSNIFKIDKTLEIKDENIFKNGTECTGKSTPKSSFLTTVINKEKEHKDTNDNLEDKNLGDLIFEHKCILYKFIDRKWDKIGPGMVYIYKNTEKRLLFIRDGVMTVPFDFYINYDIKAFKKSRGVSFTIPGNKPVLLMFEEENKQTEFFELLK